MAGDVSAAAVILSDEAQASRRLVFIADQIARGLVEDESFVPDISPDCLSPTILRFIAPMVARRFAELQAERRETRSRINHTPEKRNWR